MIIGIIGRPAITDTDNKGVLIYKKICEKLYDYGCLPIGLIPTINGMDFDKELSIDEFKRMKKLVSICDGIILQGGEDINGYDVTLAKFLYDIDKPVLGICLGMQTMGMAIGGSVINDANHNIKDEYAHDVWIDKNSKLYEIIGKEKICVNSRHNDRVYETYLDKVAYFGNMVEAIEDKNKTFYIGVQWHPEMLDDENSDKLFKTFIKACQNKINNI